MIWKVLGFLGLALCVAGDGAISHQSVVKHISPGHYQLEHIGPHKPEHHEVYAHAHPSYEFSYKVADPHTHDFKGQHEVRDGDVVKGEYWLLQPDGKKRTVKYHADKHSGFKAHVEYTPVHENIESHKEILIEHKPHEKKIVEQHIQIHHPIHIKKDHHDDHIHKVHHEVLHKPIIHHEVHHEHEIHHKPLLALKPLDHHHEHVVVHKPIYGHNLHKPLILPILKRVHDHHEHIPHKHVPLIFKSVVHHGDHHDDHHWSHRSHHPHLIPVLDEYRSHVEHHPRHWH